MVQALGLFEVNESIFLLQEILFVLGGWIQFFNLLKLIV